MPGDDAGLAERAVQPAAAARAEHRGGEIERRRVGVGGRHRTPAERELRLGDVAAQGAGAHLLARRLFRRRIARGRRRRPAGVGPAAEREHLVHRHVAHDRHDGAPGHVAGGVVAPQVVAGEAGELRLVADAPAPDAVPVEHHLVQRLVCHRRGRIELALGFLDDHLELARQLAGIDQRVPECVGLDLEPRGEAPCGQHGEVRGVIVARAGIEVAARRLGLPRDLAHPAARRPLEEHVLEHVGDPDPAVRLVEEAGLHMGDHRDGRCRRLVLREEGEPVRQHLARHPLGPAAAHSRAPRASGRRRITASAAPTRARP